MAQGFNRVIVMGNLVRDVEVKHLDSGLTVGNFTVAVNGRRKKQGEWVDHTEFIPVSVFGKTAENCDRFLSKGRMALVEGELTEDRWEDKDGQKRSRFKVMAGNVRFIGGGSGSGQAQPQERETPAEQGGDDMPF